MAYFKPYIDETGFHIPTYNEIVEELCNAAKRIFGQGLYLGSDSMDYQMIAEIAEKINDTNEASMMVYESRSATTAFGSGLDGIVAMNGLTRKLATRSVCEVTITGDVDTIIVNGSCVDANGNIWDLPERVTIPAEGKINVTATCRKYGVVFAAANSITIINTPQRGWTSVNNASDATVGSVQETDSALRARRAKSVAIPSQTILSGLYGALQTMSDVTRCVVFENEKDTVDDKGLPAHSICAVVEGGTDEDVAKMIGNKKNPGVYTYGTTEVTIEDDSGVSNTIRFFRPTYVEVSVEVTITKNTGYVDTMTDQIKSSIVGYFDNLDIGSDLYISMLWWAALSNVGGSTTVPGFSIVSIKAARSGSTLSVENVDIAFNELAQASINDVTVVVQ